MLQLTQVVCLAVAILFTSHITHGDEFGVARLYSEECYRTLPSPSMADCDNGGVCEKVNCGNESVCYLGYNVDLNMRFRGCMLRERCTILKNNTMSKAMACNTTQEGTFRETQCLYCCSNEELCNLKMIASSEWPQPEVTVVVTEPPPVPKPVPYDYIPLAAGAGGGAFVLIIIIIIVCIFVIRARRRRKNLALLVEQLEKFKSRQANRSFMDKGLDTLNATLGFGSTTNR
eukprot:sb/3469431/